MLRKTALLAAVLAIAAPLAAASTQQKGRIGTLPHGLYVCSLPGDAGGLAWRNIDGSEFSIDNASSYHTDAGSGTYLLAGKRVTFTRGPMKGMRFLRSGSNTLIKLDKDGHPGRERCVRRGGTG